jgi:hypothetical protein
MLKWKFLAVLACGAAIGAWITVWVGQKVAVVSAASAKAPTLTAIDYEEITQLTHRYAYGIDTCSNNGYDYGDVFTPDGVFIDKNTDEGFRQGGRVLARAATRWQLWWEADRAGAKTKLIWTDWSHIMANQLITPSPEGATGRIYLLQMGIKGPGSIERHGGYEDVYVKTAQGWRIRSRTHVRDKAWHNPLLQTPDLN